MQITRTSAISGIQRTIEISVSVEQLKQISDGGLVQNVCPHLTDDQREYLITGAWDGEWDKMFAGEEGDDDEAEDGLPGLPGEPLEDNEDEDNDEDEDDEDDE